MSKARNIADLLGESNLDLPSGTTAQRPASPTDGATRYNTDSGSVEFYDGTNWIATNLIPIINSVSGTIYAGAASTLTISLTNATDTVTVRFTEGGATIEDITDVAVSSGSASVTVPAAVYGQSAGDTITVSILNQDGTPSSNQITKTVRGLPTGGTITSYDNYRVHTFTSSGTFTVPAGFTASADSLVVAGGGGGGGSVGVTGAGGGGGGGAGGMLVRTSESISENNYSVVVGAGGSGDSSGGNSYVSPGFGSSSLGGGSGGRALKDTTGDSGGSGGSGGGAGGSSDGYSGGSAGSGTSGQGYQGGLASNVRCGGGGGGKTQTGSNSSSAKAGDGGDGATNNFRTGSNIYYAGGGGGGCGSATNPSSTQFGVGGLGGGGNGAADGSPAAYIQTAGQANTGGGGGGANDQDTSNAVGASGGSGIVVIRYQIS